LSHALYFKVTCTYYFVTYSQNVHVRQFDSASEMTYIVSSGALNSTHSPRKAVRKARLDGLTFFSENKVNQREQSQFVSAAVRRFLHLCSSFYRPHRSTADRCD